MAVLGDVRADLQSEASENIKTEFTMRTIGVQIDGGISSHNILTAEEKQDFYGFVTAKVDRQILGQIPDIIWITKEVEQITVASLIPTSSGFPIVIFESNYSRIGIEEYVVGTVFYVYRKISMLTEDEEEKRLEKMSKKVEKLRDNLREGNVFPFLKKTNTQSLKYCWSCHWH